MTVLLVALGTAVGAVCRWRTDRAVSARLDSALPWGTLTVNLLGSALLGLVLAAVALGDAGDGVAALLGTGFCGGFTTYSTFAAETQRLRLDGSGRLAARNVAANTLGSLGTAFLGWWSGTLLWG